MVSGGGITKQYRKVGRLKPDETLDYLRVIIDSLGEIGTITRVDAEELLAGVKPQPVLPSGFAVLSISERGVMLMIPTSDGHLYVAMRRQVRNILDKWPKRKAAVFLVGEC